MNQSHQFTCGHCQGTSLCNCNVCGDNGKSVIKADNTKEGHTRRFETGAYSNFYICTICEGTGHVFPTNVHIAHIEQNKLIDGEHEQYLKRVSADISLLDEEAKITDAKLEVLKLVNKTTAQKIELQRLINDAPKAAFSIRRFLFGR